MPKADPQNRNEDHVALVEHVDVTDLSLVELMTTQDTVIAHALRRIRHETDRPADSVSGWSSYLKDEPDRGEVVRAAPSHGP